MGYDTDRVGMYRPVGAYTGQILKGVKPADLPVLQTTTARFVPGTILRWHRFGFKAFWRWKSRNRAGRSKIDRGLRDLIRRMCRENPLWGAPRIHGELLMLGFDVAQSTTDHSTLGESVKPTEPKHMQVFIGRGKKSSPRTSLSAGR